MKLRRLGFALALLFAPAATRAWVPIPAELQPDGPVPVTIALTATAPSGQSADWIGAVTSAMAAWNAHLQRIQLTSNPSNVPPWYENGHNEVFFDRNMFDEPFPSGVLAVTSTSHDRGHPVETDIVFNTGYQWSVYSGTLRPGTPDARRVAIHELGHLLGLNHPDEAGQTVAAIMRSVISNTDQLTADDQAGAHALYDFGPGAPPVVVLDPQAQSVVQGQTVTFTSEAGGRGPLTYEWRRDGVFVSSGSSREFTFTAQLTDAGNYTVTVRSPGGATTSRDARLTVRAAVAPEIPFVSAGYPVAAGDTLRIYPYGSLGDAPRKIEWRRDGVVIATSTESTELAIPDMQFSDAGHYTVTIMNAAGTAVSAATIVTVMPGQPPRFLSAIPSTAIAPGGRITLEPNVDATGSVTYQWQKDGVDIPGANSRSYSIEQFGAAQVGSYTVTATNGLGRATSGAGQLTLYDLAKFVIVRQPGTAEELTGGAVSFSVETSLSATSYRWFKNGVALPATNVGRVAGSQTQNLSIANLSPSDTGDYAVEVSNGVVTRRSQNARLNVLPTRKPIITRQPASHTVTVGQPVALSIAIRRWTVGSISLGGGAPYSYQWFKDFQPLPGKTSDTLNLTAQAADAGLYCVQVTSPDGVTSSENAEVQIVPAPTIFQSHPPSQLFEPNSEDLRLTAVSYEVARRREIRDGGSYVWRRGTEVLLDTGPFIATYGLQPGTYTITIERGGVTQESKPFTLDFIPPSAPVIARHPRGAAVGAGENFQLSFDIAPVAGATYQWFKDGVPIGAANGLTFGNTYFRASDAGRYQVQVTNSVGTAMSDAALVELRGAIAPLIERQPASATSVAGRSVAFSVGTQSRNPTFQWFKDGIALPGATQSTLFVTASAATAGAYTCRVSDDTETVTSQAAQLTVLAAQRPPDILQPPVGGTGVVGGDFTLGVAADGGPLPDRYQWLKDGVPIPGATDAKLRLHNLRAEDAGRYTVIAYNATGSTTSAAAALVVDVSGRMINLATRAQVGTGDNILIAGFGIAGPDPRKLLIRAIGDQLNEYGLNGVLRDPVLTIYNAKQEVLARNDDWWRDGAVVAVENAAREVGAFAQRRDTRDSAVLVTLDPGTYTAQVAGLAKTTGIALVELYELGTPAPGRLINLSSRGFVGTGDAILIPSLVIRGQASRRLLIRAVGPGLSGLGVKGALADPILTVMRGETAVASNDNWGEQERVAELSKTMTASGAFPLQTGSRDAAVLVDLPPDNYTIHVAGVGDTTGIALVEIYEVRP